MPCFGCLKGDCAEVALQEPGCFVVVDAKGETWLCVQRAADDEDVDLAQTVAGILPLQRMAAKQGFAKHGTRAKAIRCGRDELAERLAEEQPGFPPSSFDAIEQEAFERNKLL